MDNDLISIIIPVYNVKPYLNRCILSIVHQTYTNLEIILIDDGSTDGSGEICKQWEKRDKRIRCIHQENAGISAARNTGINVAHGDFLGFVDSDDYVEEDMFEYLLTNKSPGGITICGFFVESKDLTEFRSPGGRMLNAKEAVTTYLQDELNCRLTPKPLSMGSYVWNRLFDRVLFSKIRFPVGKKYEDAAVVCELFLSSVVIKTCPECKYHYVQRDDSITHLEKISCDLIVARNNQLTQVKALGEIFEAQVEKLLICEYYSIFKHIIRLPKEEQEKNREIKRECLRYVKTHRDTFNLLPFSFRRKFLMKIWLGSLYSLYWRGFR